MISPFETCLHYVTLCQGLQRVKPHNLLTNFPLLTGNERVKICAECNPT